jgi:hypothetical protein
MRSLVRPFAAAAVAVPLLAVARPAAADHQVASEFSETQATFTSTETGEQVWCSVNGLTTVEQDGTGHTTTESSGDYSECYDTRVELHATWTDSAGRTRHVSVVRRTFIKSAELEDVASDLVVRHVVVYGLCDTDDQCRYELETSPK